jgi:ribonuclease BN (tRNA processing enzyme)
VITRGRPNSSVASVPSVSLAWRPEHGTLMRHRWLHSDVKLTAIGTAAAGVPRPGDAGSGYLLEEGDTRLLIDCGGGVLGNLVRHAPLESISGVYVSHLHNDHVAELYPIALWSRFSKRGLPVYGPPGTRTLLYRWFSLFASDPDPYVESLKLTEYKEWTPYELGALKFMPCPVEHNVACFALRAEANGKRFVFSGDSRAGALLEEAAQQADLFLCEATFQDLLPGKIPEKTRDHHMTAREAGALAKSVHARRLVLTHLRDDLDPAVSAKQAEETFGQRVHVARPHDTFEP